jgi:hypothetical protein
MLNTSQCISNKINNLTRKNGKFFRTASLNRKDGSGLSAYERLFGRPPQQQHVAATGSATAAGAKKPPPPPLFITKAGRRRDKVWQIFLSFVYHHYVQMHFYLNAVILIKETVSRDFRPLVFFHKSTSPRPLINTLKYFRILFRIRGATRL